MVLGDESKREPESKSERAKGGMRGARMCTHPHTHTHAHAHILTHKRSSTQYKNINVIIKLTGKEIQKIRRKVERADTNTNNSEINEDNGFLTGVPKTVFVVRLMEQISHLIAGLGGKGGEGEEKGRVLPVYNLLLESKSGPPRGQGAKNIFPVFARSCGLNRSSSIDRHCNGRDLPRAFRFEREDRHHFPAV